MIDLTTLENDDLLWLFDNYVTCHTYCPTDCHHDDRIHKTTQSALEEEILRRMNCACKKSN